MLYFGTECSIFEKEIKYVAESLFRIMNLKWRWIEISELKNLKKKDFVIIYGDRFDKFAYSRVPCNILGIRNSKKLFGTNFKKSESICIEPIILKEFVSLYRENDNSYTSDINVVNYDIIADCFFMLSRYEEYFDINPTPRDEYGRFSGKDSIAYKFGFLNRPIVDEWAFYIKKYIVNSGCIFAKQITDRKPKLLVTHDVDTLNRYSDWIEAVLGMYKKEISFKELILGKNPYDNLLKIARWEYKKNISADYYFIPVKEENNADYSINNKKLKKKINVLCGLGHQIGYHAGFNTSDNMDLYSKEIKNLREVLGEKYKIIGSRQHYLKNKIPDTFLALEQQGILYDTTLAFADMEGFRCGTCHPFKHWNIFLRREMNIWEIPLVFMDVTLKNYQKYSTTILREKFEEYYKIVEKFEGVLNILWHNNRFAEAEWKDYNKEYCSYVKLLSNRLCSCNGKKIIDEYKKMEDCNG